MKAEDLRFQWLFTLRTAMYTMKEEKYAIAAFLHGYDFGRSDGWDFFARLSDSIAKDYKVQCRATGWFGQIEMLAEKLDSDWVSVFKQQTIKLTLSELEGPSRQEFFESLTNGIAARLSSVDRSFRREFVVNWYGLVGLQEDWFLELWAEKELTLLRQIDQEITTYGSVRSLKEDIEPTDKLKALCKELLQEMNC